MGSASESIANGYRTPSPPSPSLWATGLYSGEKPTRFCLDYATTRSISWTTSSGKSAIPRHAYAHNLIIRSWAGAIILEIAYGYRVTSNKDPLVEIAERTTVETVLGGSPGSMLVDFFPIRASLISDRDRGET